MNEPSKWSGLCAVAGPIVRAKVRRLAVRHRLQRCDRDDLEQEIYVTLLACRADVLSMSVRGEPSGDGSPGRQPDDGQPVEERPHLVREVDRLAESLVRGWPFRRPDRPLRPLRPSAAAVRAARSSSGRPDAHDLRLDVAVALAGLPEDVRTLCAQLVTDDLASPAHIHPVQSEVSAPWALAGRAVALRQLFTSLDLHHYL
jgi:DNA-directed RNA polymerase specialized sigma24 family protein